jgi:hypothetical protein
VVEVAREGDTDPLHGALGDAALERPAAHDE